MCKRFFIFAETKAVDWGHWHGGLFFFPPLEQRALFPRELRVFRARVLEMILTTFTTPTFYFTSLACTMLLKPYF
jgi:hypothetical protein